jgi:hypothetical protein
MKGERKGMKKKEQKGLIRMIKERGKSKSKKDDGGSCWIEGKRRKAKLRFASDRCTSG